MYLPESDRKLLSSIPLEYSGLHFDIRVFDHGEVGAIIVGRDLYMHRKLFNKYLRPVGINPVQWYIDGIKEVGSGLDKAIQKAVDQLDYESMYRDRLFETLRNQVLGRSKPDMIFNGFPVFKSPFAGSYIGYVESHI